MEINFTDYLSKEEIHDICADQLRKEFHDYCSNDLENVISNIAYCEVSAMCDKEIPEFKSLLLESIQKVISGLSPYTVFRGVQEYGWSYRTPASKGYTMLEEIVSEQRSKLEQRIIELLSGDSINYTIEQAVKEGILKQFGITQEDE